MKCSNNLKQLSLGTINAADTNNTNLPPSIGLYPSTGSPAPRNSDGGLFLHILPYIEQDNLYKASLATPEPNDRNGGLPTYSQWTTPIQQSHVKAYICPSDYTQSDGSPGHASYSNNGQIFRHNYNWGRGLSRYPATIQDGTSNTIFFTDKLAQCNSGQYPNNYWPDWGPVISSDDVGDPVGPNAPIFQSQPTVAASSSQANCNGGIASSPHSGGINVALADGSVRFVSPSVSSPTWWAAMTPAGNEILGSDW